MSRRGSDRSFTPRMVDLDSSAPAIVPDAPAATAQWRKLDFAGPCPSDAWLRIVYHSSFLDFPVRSVLRFVGHVGYRDELLPAAIFGRGVWIGKAPAGVQEIRISPTNKAGDFGFEIETFEVQSLPRVLARALIKKPYALLDAAWSIWIRRWDDAARKIACVVEGASLEDYDRWRRERSRPFDSAGIDRCRIKGRGELDIRLAVAFEPVQLDRLVALMERLGQQSYERWSLAVVCEASQHPELEPLRMAAAGRLICVDARQAASELASGLGGAALIGRLGVDDELPDYALAALAHYASLHAEYAFIYGDEDEITGDGRFTAPRLKPDWSPLFQAHAPYLGAATFVRAANIAANPNGFSAQGFADTSSELVAFATTGNVGHLPRVLLSRRMSKAKQSRLVQAPKANIPAAEGDRPIASIIIPTRDRHALLRACIDSAISRARRDDIEFIIVDNGSEQRETKALLDELASRKGFRIIERPGPFNYAWLCNQAAAIAHSDTLVFLNNDTEAVSDRWVDALVAPARDDAIGAVGAKLLFDNGTLQHAGVVMGLYGKAFHINHRCDPDGAGYLDRLRVSHEVSAVTAACMAVSKAKFDAVGGFDEINLPVELNDIDLCLRLREKGWVNVVAMNGVLVHHESASRGYQPPKVYDRERAWFEQRWADAIRDDPYFHPAFSLRDVVHRLA